MTLESERPPRQPFRHRVRVYYEDTDAAGVVYYANYLKFLERARTEFFRALGMELSVFEREHRSAFVVSRLDIAYRAPARLDDELDITVLVGDRGLCRLNLAQTVMREADCLASARVSLACLDPTRWRPVRLPAPLVLRLDAHLEKSI